MWKEEDSLKRPKYSILPNTPALHDAKNGVATSKCVAAFRDRFMQEGNHNQVYGAYKGEEVGICLNSNLSNRNTNTLVVGSTHDFRDNYLMPNLLKGHSSAVVVHYDADIILEKYGERFRENGYQTVLLDFTDSEIYKKFYNTPEAYIENKPDISDVSAIFDVAKLATEKTYLFIKYPSAFEPAPFTFFINALIHDLYRYGEKYIQSPEDTRPDFLKNSQFLPQNVHFYLSCMSADGLSRIENLLKFLSTDRIYGIGITLQIEDIVYLEHHFGEKSGTAHYETLYANVDQLVFLGMRSDLYWRTAEFIMQHMSVFIKPNGEEYSAKEISEMHFAEILKLPKKCLFTEEDIQEIFKSGKMIFVERDVPAMILDRLEGRDYGERTEKGKNIQSKG